MEEEPWKPQTLQNPSVWFIPCDFGEVERVDLHHSADASEGQGLWNSIVLQFVNKEGRIYVSFDIEKSRVRPLRSSISVPKLQLMAATLLIQMNVITERKYKGRTEGNSVTF